jgi:YHS domain-containing protein
MQVQVTQQITQPNTPRSSSDRLRGAAATGVSARPAPRQAGRFGPASLWRWTRHYLEMAVAMFAGMLVLGLAVSFFGRPPGYDTLLVHYGYMAVAMSVPMIAWMRRMGHPWFDCWEMTAWMVVPMFACVVPVALGLDGAVPGLTAHSLMLVSHVAMLAGMAVPMLYRWDTYANGHCHAPKTMQAPGPLATVGVSAQAATAADPVCGMPVDPTSAKHTVEHEGKTYAFCAPGCKKAFQRDPATFLSPDYVPSM